MSGFRVLHIPIYLALFAASGAHAEPDLSREEFYACRVDGECTIMGDPCGFPAGINRAYQRQYGVASYNSNKGECPTPEHPLSSFSVRCEDLRCTPKLKPSAIEQPE